MCVPKPSPIVPQPTPVPSMQAASSLSLANAGSPRGAAGLGRLQLRIGGGSSTPAPSTPAPQVAASTVPANPTNLATAAPYGGVGTSPGSLAGLRFGNYGAAFI